MLASSGQAGAPALPDDVPDHSQDASIVGWVVFSGMQHYTDKAAWAAGRERHLVDGEGPYGWLDGASDGVQTDATRQLTVDEAASLSAHTAA